jgi:hypothetical protein
MAWEHAPMNEGWIAGVISVVAALIGQTRLTSRPERLRKRIEATHGLLASLADDSHLQESRERLRSLIAEQIDYLAKIERKSMERRYDPSQLIISALFAVPTFYGGYRLWGMDDWYWRALAILLGLFGLLLVWIGIENFLKPPRARRVKDGEVQAVDP